MIGFKSSILAGVVLMRDSIQSPNYVAGVSGWTINQDGSVEFNNATIRGSLSAGGGTVLVNDLGVYVTDNDSTQQYAILRDGGFIARNNPDDGQHTQMYTLGLAITQPTVSPNGFASTYASFDVQAQTIGAEDFVRANMNTGTINGQSDASILLRSEGSGGTAPYAEIDATNVGSINLISQFTSVAHRLISTQTGMDYAATQIFTVVMNLTAGGTGIALGATNYPVAFPVGSTLWGFCNINNGSGNVRGWVPQWLDVSNSQFNLVVRNALAGGGPANLAVDVDVVVFIVPS